MFNQFDNMLKSYMMSDQYKSLVERIEKLEEENIENTNLIYELQNSLEAIDRRIDIIAEEFKLNKDV